MENINQQKTAAPYAVTSMVLGIASIVFGCFLVGLVLGIIGLVLANKGYSIYNLSPQSYTGEGMLKAGKITSIIGIVFGGIYLIWFIIATVILGSSAFGFAMLEELLG